MWRIGKSGEDGHQAHGNAKGFVLQGGFHAIAWADAADSVAVFTDSSEGWTCPI